MRFGTRLLCLGMPRTMCCTCSSKGFAVAVMSASEIMCTRAFLRGCRETGGASPGFPSSSLYRSLTLARQCCVKSKKKKKKVCSRQSKFKSKVLKQPQILIKSDRILTSAMFHQKSLWFEIYMFISFVVLSA